MNEKINFDDVEFGEPIEKKNLLIVMVIFEVYIEQEI